LLLLQGFCGMSYGLVVSAGLEDETEVIIVTIASIFPLLLLSGKHFLFLAECLYI